MKFNSVTRTIITCFFIQLIPHGIFLMLAAMASEKHVATNVVICTTGLMNKYCEYFTHAAG